MDMTGVNGERRGDCSYGARSAQRMADQRLGGAHGNLIRTLAEEKANGFAFHGITNGSGCGMGIDIVHLSGSHSGIL